MVAAVGAESILPYDSEQSARRDVTALLIGMRVRLPPLPSQSTPFQTEGAEAFDTRLGCNRTRSGRVVPAIRDTRPSSSVVERPPCKRMVLGSIPSLG